MPTTITAMPDKSEDQLDGSLRPEDRCATYRLVEPHKSMNINNLVIEGLSACVIEEGCA